MAKVVYEKARTAFMKGEIDMLTDNIKVSLIDAADYTFSQTHEFWDDVAVAARVATSGNLGTKTVTDPGTFDAADVTLSSVTGDVSEALILWKDTATESTSPLLMYDDAASGLPITPNGQDINITWDAGGIMII